MILLVLLYQLNKQIGQSCGWKLYQNFNWSRLTQIFVNLKKEKLLTHYQIKSKDIW